MKNHKPLKNYFCSTLVLFFLVVSLFMTVARHADASATPSVSPSPSSAPTITPPPTIIPDNDDDIPTLQAYVRSSGIAHVPKGTVINSCGTYTGSGTYTLGQNLGSTTTSGCITIENANNFNLNCAGHYIDYSPSSYAGNTDLPVIEVVNSQNSSVRNCVLSTASQYPLTVLDSTSTTIYGNTFNITSSPFNFGIPYIYVNTSDKTVFSNNTVHVVYMQDSSTNGTITNNSFTLPQYSDISANIILSKGSANTISNNTLDGGSAGQPQVHTGADDGIVMSENSDVISGNIISNDYDAGIETTGLITNSTFDSNQINNTGVAGISSYYYTSWMGNTVSNNTVNNSSSVFYFYRIGGLLLGENLIYFENNNFINNQFKNQKPPTAAGCYLGSSCVYPAYFGFTLPLDIRSSTAEHQATSSQLLLSNNLFKNNNFGIGSPVFISASMIVDGGGNICTPPQGISNYPIVCHTIAVAAPQNEFAAVILSNLWGNLKGLFW